MNFSNYQYYAEIIEACNGEWALNLYRRNHEEAFHTVVTSFEAAYKMIEEIKNTIHHINVIRLESVQCA